MNPLIVIQARLGSTRLPGKVLMSVGDGANMASATLNRVLKVGSDIKIAVPEHDKWAFEIRHVPDSVIVVAPPVPEDDVLARFFYISNAWHNPIIRITADCPLIDPHVIRRALDEYDGTGLVASTKAPDYNIGYPDGQDVEVFSREMLEQAFVECKPNRLTGESSPAYERNPQREHVTAWMRENCLVTILDHVPPVKCKLSVDTWEDLQFVKR
jgi:spore coat polysaccharide biosynthesis protein SpsF (cytidylyltransferase family)